MTQHRLRHFLSTRRARLAASYLAIIMALTIPFSIVVYQTSATHFDRFAPPPNMRPQIVPSDIEQQRAIFSQRRQEAQAELATNTIVLDILALFGGAFFSYYLAGRTLKPIEDAMHAQAQFISDASHELRTPLATLQTSNEVMLKTTKHLSGDMRDLLKSNVQQTEKLRNLTDGLLGLIKAEHGRPRIAPFSIAAAAREATKLVEADAAKKNINLSYGTDKIRVVADEDSVVRVLRVFVENAVKYSGKNSKISILFTRHDGLVDVSVNDEGIGIDKKDINNIFKRFFRVDASRSSQNTEGYGLGLAIVKTICEQQHIPLSVQSKLGNGSTFTITLPVEK